jgi:hypothetical protein
MIQLQSLCIVSKLPTKLHRDNKNRLHSDEGPAIAFGDGYELYFWKGTNIPPHWIDNKEAITIDELKTSNAELRRVLIDILGVSEFYRMLGDKKGIKVLGQQVDNQGLLMRLLQIEFEGNQVQALECICPSTKRIYNLYSPNQSATTAWEAKAAIGHQTVEECIAMNTES